jgi:hypothetical protein
MRLRVLLTALTMIFAASTASAAECIQDNQADQIAEGRLSLGQFEDAAGNLDQAFILTLPVPTCLKGSNADSTVDSTTTIHTFSLDEAIRASIEKFVGKDVHVARHAVRCSHRAPSCADRYGRERYRRDLTGPVDLSSWASPKPPPVGVLMMMASPGSSWVWSELFRRSSRPPVRLTQFSPG